MPIETDLKTAYDLLYNAKEPEKALELYDSILKQSPESIVANIYKAASLEKLYYGFKSWHSQETLENAQGILEKALRIALERQNRSKQALVYFRLFVHYYNRKRYLDADAFFRKARELGYKDDTLPIWEANLTKKVEKWKRKHKDEVPSLTAQEGLTSALLQSQNGPQKDDASLAASEMQEPPKAADERSFKLDWYQSATSVTISVFTTALPRSKETVITSIASNNRDLEVSYPVAKTGSEFQFSVRLSREVDPQSVRVNVLSKKIEVVLMKKQKQQWKQLESSDGEEEASATQFSAASTTPASAHSYPTSSKKNIDWSKIDVDEEEQAQSADAFFQQIYAGADPDTRRAMMKSYVESNGTALNTNWEEVSKKPVEAAPPDGTEAKKW